MNHTQAALLAARTLIANKKDWIQGFSALNENGSQVTSTDPTACQWCATGALWAQELGGRTMDIAWRRLNEAAKELGHMSAIDLNDYSSHAAVLKMYDRALELAGSQRKR